MYTWYPYFFKNLHNNYWWRWIYLFGGSYVLWVSFIVLGLLAFVLGIHLLKKKNNVVESVKQ